MFKKVPGTRDILPQEVSRWQNIEEISRRVFTIYNYQEIRSPVIEEALLFNRSLGDSTEIVQKQMFLTKSAKSTYALRPEGTASVARSYIENNLNKTQGFVKLYYIGPMFRLERPQKGRLRQFHHLGCEVIGSVEPLTDVEIISLADNLLEAFSIADYQIHLNSLGCSKDKKELARIIHKGLKDKLSKLCADCRRRLKINILRVLDCKNKTCQEVVRKLNIHDEHLCLQCKNNFEKIKEGLDLLKIDYHINPFLVRGLDYYTGTVFEITHKQLGAQDALGAGGRYDNLIKELGGTQAGAIGFAFGIERLLLVSNPKPQTSNPKLVYIIPLGEKARIEGSKLLDNLRKAGIASDTDYEGKSLKGAMRRANDLGAKYVVIIGEDEIKKSVVTLKDMESGEQREVRQNDIVRELQNKSQIPNHKSQTNPNIK
jgi:histidyl-tRNA synthetase